jgi:MSHA pilin protein MshC
VTPRARSAGFTIVELVVVMIIVAALAAVGIPHLMGDKSMEAAVFGDQVVSGLRRAHKLATGHRRVVRAAVGPQAVVLRLNASGSNWIALDGVADDDYGTTDSALSSSTATLYFQPDGRITQDAAGLAPAVAAIVITRVVDGNASPFRTINVQGTTGYVE